PLSDIARELGLKPVVLRYAVNGLIDRGVVTGVYPFVNLCKLGYCYYNALFSVASPSENTRKELRAQISAMKNTVWCGEYAGLYRYGMTIAAQTPSTVAEVLSVISHTFGPVITEKAVSTKLAMTFWGRRYLSANTECANTSFSYQTTTDRAEIDSTDHKILIEMTRSRGASQRELGRKLAVPASTLRRRVDQMQTTGLIGGYRYHIDTSLLGVNSYALLISSRGVDPKTTELLHNFCASNPNVVFFVEALGSWDYEIGVECFEPEVVTRVVDALHDLLPSRVIEMRPLQITKELKHNDYPFQSLVEKVRRIHTPSIDGLKASRPTPLSRTLELLKA
ncbi:MAG: AsnC family transcriptional regulator, partial [Bdellovibrionales bacterium]|nr:AsnC family transcriptional regulator [Bdellovibrionales bacterium]